MSGAVFGLCVCVALLLIIGTCLMQSNLPSFRWYRKFRGGKWGKYRSISGDWYWERIEQEEMEDYTQRETHE